MMRSDYEPFFQEFQSTLSKVGVDFLVVNESELTAILQLDHDWALTFDCERYYGPAFTVSIAPTVKEAMLGKGYTLRILMEVFGAKKGKDYGVPNFQNQALFLATERETLFLEPEYYKTEYEKLNDSLS